MARLLFRAERLACAQDQGQFGTAGRDLAPQRTDFLERLGKLQGLRLVSLRGRLQGQLQGGHLLARPRQLRLADLAPMLLVTQFGANVLDGLPVLVRSGVALSTQPERGSTTGMTATAK